MPADLPAPTASVETITAGLAAVDYIASRPIATALLLARDLGKPVLVEEATKRKEQILSEFHPQHISVDLDQTLRSRYDIRLG